MQIRLNRCLTRMRVERAQQAHGRPQGLHGLHLRDALQKFDHGAGKSALQIERTPHLLEFGLLGQPSVPEQKGDLFKAGVVGQSVDVVAAIGQYARLPVDETDRALGGDDAFQSFCRRVHDPSL